VDAWCGFTAVLMRPSRTRSVEDPDSDIARWLREPLIDLAQVELAEGRAEVFVVEDALVDLVAAALPIQN